MVGQKEAILRGFERKRRRMLWLCLSFSLWGLRFWSASPKKTPPCSTSEEPIWTFHTLLTLVCSVSSIWTYLISTEFSCCFCVCLGSVVIDPLNLYPLQYYCISRLHYFNFSSCRTSKPSRTPVVCKVLNLSVYMCMNACYLYLCERQRDDVQETMHTHTHTHRSLSPTQSASLFIHLLQLSGRLYHPVSHREITSDKLGWLNRLGKLTDPANHHHPLCHYLPNNTLHGRRAWSSKITWKFEMLRGSVEVKADLRCWTPVLCKLLC